MNPSKPLRNSNPQKIGVSFTQIANPKLASKTPPTLTRNQRLTEIPGDNHLNHWFTRWEVRLCDWICIALRACLRKPIDIPNQEQWYKIMFNRKITLTEFKIKEMKKLRFKVY